ncbi:MAG: hypothetical protein KF872_06095 [Chitinophagales bacterium]|nr:hypothetical protein [Chitinophagales bacterium]
MTILEIKENIVREDKMMCAIKCETAETTINDMLAGRRNRETELGRKIMAELERLARINISAKKQKQLVA